jgi:hypothetical protein
MPAEERKLPTGRPTCAVLETFRDLKDVDDEA